jgi:hypothetical protein
LPTLAEQCLSEGRHWLKKIYFYGDIMNDVNAFHKGDVVAFKIDVDNLSKSSAEYQYCVVEIKDGNISISQHGNVKEVSPFELLTQQEVEKAKKEASEAVDNYMKG